MRFAIKRPWPRGLRDNLGVDKAARRLDELRHHEILEPLLDGAGILGVRGAACFRALHREQLIGIDRELASPRCGAEDFPRLLWKGRTLSLMGRSEPARAMLKVAVRKNRSDPRGWGYLGAAWFEDDLNKSIKCFDRASQVDPHWPWAYLWRAVSRLKIEGGSAAIISDLDEFERLEPPARALAYLHRAICWLDMGRWGEAEQAAGKLVSLEPGSCSGYSLRFQSRLLAHRWEGIEEDYHRARDLDPDCGGYEMVKIGFRAPMPRDMGKKLEFMDHAIREFPRLRLLRVERAEVLRSVGINRFDLSLDVYRSLEKFYSERAWFQAHMARAEMKVVGPDKSIARLDRACALSPQSGWIWAWLGAAKRSLGLERQAMRDIEKSVQMCPWYSPAYAWKGAVLYEKGRFKPAVRALDAALEMGVVYPTNGFAYFTRSIARKKMHDVLGAAEDMLRAVLQDSKYTWDKTISLPHTGAKLTAEILALRTGLKANPDHAAISAWRGYLRLLLKDWEGAIVDLSAALRWRKEAIFYTWRATAHLGRGHAAAAAADIRMTLRIDPDFAPAADIRADLLMAEGRWRRALAVLDATGGDRTNAAFFLKKAEALRRLGRFKESIDEAALALQLDGRLAQAHALMASVFLSMGRSRLALKEAAQAIALNPDMAMAHVTSGMARANLGDLRGQIRDLRAAYRLNQDLFRDLDPALMSALSS